MLGSKTSPYHLPELTPELLNEVEGLQLSARSIASGALAGMHRSLRRGASIEFSEHKLYTPGDDIRHIDWRAFAKTDRFHVKQFEDETNLRIELLLDHSGSMGFKSESSLSKFHYARALGAAITYLALRQGDSTGLTTFESDVTGELPPRAHSSHLFEILSRLAQLTPQGETGISPCLQRFAQTRRKKTIAIILTDLLDPSPKLETAFRQLVARRHEVAVLHILDPAEIDFPYESPARFASMEDTRKLFIHPRVLQSAYQKEMRAFLDTTETTMRGNRIDYHLIRTDTPPQKALASFLRTRSPKVI
jgi:uncharacterized protein (DUF58 family)